MMVVEKSLVQCAIKKINERVVFIFSFLSPFLIVNDAEIYDTWPESKQ